MQAATPLIVSTENTDPQALKQWAAEDFAISIGLLRECPYHGQPFKPDRKDLSIKTLATGLIDPLDPAVQIFNGNTRELLAAVERVSRDYGERCVFCAACDQEEDFD
jgi:hypothetical protein